ncbi:MAG: hypothetical protein U9Q77_04795 [Candidatus Marinimicrobia bacterium]|nr:hypothetical protein [Candidatus Neomarinimicrobiota bacterium]
MKCIRLFLVVMVTISLCMSCSSTLDDVAGKPGVNTMVSPDPMPDWYRFPVNDDELNIYAVGSGQSSIREMAESSARSEATTFISSGISQQVTRTLHEYSIIGSESADVHKSSPVGSIVQAMNTQTIGGLIVHQRYFHEEEDGSWKVVVQVGLSKAALNTALLNEINSGKPLYKKFKGSIGFSEFESSLK